MRLELTVACGAYEITRGLVDGNARADGIDLLCLTQDTERIYRSDRRAECDVAEHNLFAFMKEWESGGDVAAIPVFPHRRFRHGSIFVPAASSVTSPRELVGGRIGVGGYQPAAAIWLRGILHDYYGVPMDQVSWVDVFGLLGDVPNGVGGPLSASDPMSRFRIDGYVEDGSLDALLSAYNPVGLHGSPATIRRLFADFSTEEKRYYRDTGIFPIMHVVTVRRSLLDEHPWVAASLFRAFSVAKQQAMHRLRNPRYLPLAFAQAAWREQDELLGPDPWQYGLTDANRRVLTTAIAYAHQQGYLAHIVDPEELFVPVDGETPSGYEIR